MTYHSAKGMDFDNVFLPFLSDDISISRRDEETLFMEFEDRVLNG